jgi:hypothetical protein
MDKLPAHYVAFLDKSASHDFVIPGDSYSAIADAIDFVVDNPMV